MFFGSDVNRVITVTEKKVKFLDPFDEDNVTGIPALSMITAMVAVAVMALRRRPE